MQQSKILEEQWPARGIVGFFGRLSWTFLHFFLVGKWPVNCSLEFRINGWAKLRFSFPARVKSKLPVQDRILTLVGRLSKCVKYTVATQDGTILLMDNKADVDYASYVFVRSQNITQLYKMEVLERPGKKLMNLIFLNSKNWFLSRMYIFDDIINFFIEPKHMIKHHFEVHTSGPASKLMTSLTSFENIPESVLSR